MLVKPLVPAVALATVGWTAIAAGGSAPAMSRLKPVADEIIASCDNPNNGAGVFWCYGAPLIVRSADLVFASVMETSPDVAPLCNTRPRLMMRRGGRWRVVWAPPDFREREPCPLVLSAGRILVTVNPLIDDTAQRRGPCRPGIMVFNLDALDAPPRLLRPDFEPGARFTEHSYRGIGADWHSGEVLALNIDAETGQYFWVFGDGAGRWLARGRLKFPIRACYPQVAVNRRAAHVLAVGDIYEPVEQWRKYKREKTGRQWDYVFRRLFYAWTADITAQPFGEPLEIANLDATAGHILNLDLYVDDTGAAHILYRWSPVQNQLMRDRFFPNLRLVNTLEYVVVRGGRVVSRRSLAKGGEGLDSFVPYYARFHVSADGHLFALVTGQQPGQGPAMYLQSLTGQDARWPIELDDPPTIIFTASPRSGTRPCDTVDILASGPAPGSVRYLQLKLPAARGAR